jgi:hypothetical protein
MPESRREAGVHRQGSALNKRKSLESLRLRSQTYRVSKVQQIEQDLEKLSPAELNQIRDFLDDLLEDELDFTLEFEAQIRQSEKEIAASLRPRIRKP